MSLPPLTTTTALRGRSTGAPPSARRRTSLLGPTWGLVPFACFLLLFLFVPAVSVFVDALRTENGVSLAAMGEAASGQNRQALVFSVTFSAGAALVGVLVGTTLAYAATTIRRPRWLRSAVTSFSGVAANMGGLPLAFAFLTLLGRQGILTKILGAAGWDLYAGDFELGSVPGLITVYSYFNIPLMVLVTLPAIDGLKPAWREACSSLGGTGWTYWRRVGLPVLMPSLLGGFMLLFANSFSAYATAAVLTDNSKIIARRIGFFLGGDVSIGEDAVGFALASWMILITALAMGIYWMTRRRAERWKA